MSEKRTLMNTAIQSNVQKIYAHSKIAISVCHDSVIRDCAMRLLLFHMSSDAPGDRKSRSSP